MGSGFTGEGYVRRSGKRIFVTSSCFDNPQTAFTPHEARVVADRLVAEADAAEEVTATSAVTVRLARDEAEALAAVLGRVGGDPRTSPRGKTAATLARLTAAGVKPADCKFETVAGGLWFKDYDGRGATEATKLFAELILARTGA